MWARSPAPLVRLPLSFPPLNSRENPPKNPKTPTNSLNCPGNRSQGLGAHFSPSHSRPTSAVHEPSLDTKQKQTTMHPIRTVAGWDPSQSGPDRRTARPSALNRYQGRRSGRYSQACFSSPMPSPGFGPEPRASRSHIGQDNPADPVCSSRPFVAFLALAPASPINRSPRAMLSALETNRGLRAKLPCGRPPSAKGPRLRRDPCFLGNLAGFPSE